MVAVDANGGDLVERARRAPSAASTCWIRRWPCEVGADVFNQPMRDQFLSGDIAVGCP